MVSGQFGLTTQNVQFHNTDRFSSWEELRAARSETALVNKRSERPVPASPRAIPSRGDRRPPRHAVSRVPATMPNPSIERRPPVPETKNVSYDMDAIGRRLDGEAPVPQKKAHQKADPTPVTPLVPVAGAETKPDIQASDIGMLMCGVCSTMDARPGFDWRRHLDLVVDLLRPG